MVGPLGQHRSGFLQTEAPSTFPASLPVEIEWGLGNELLICSPAASVAASVAASDGANDGAFPGRSDGRQDDVAGHGSAVVSVTWADTSSFHRQIAAGASSLYGRLQTAIAAEMAEEADEAEIDERRERWRHVSRWSRHVSRLLSPPSAQSTLAAARASPHSLGISAADPFAAIDAEEEWEDEVGRWVVEGGCFERFYRMLITPLGSPPLTRLLGGIDAEEEEFEDEAVPPEDLNPYWPAVASCAAIGWRDTATALLRFHSSYREDQVVQREAENGLVEAVAVLLAEMPMPLEPMTARDAAEVSAYHRHRDHWRNRLARLKASPFWAAADAPATERALLALLDLLLGSSRAVDDVARSHWLELLGARLLHQNPQAMAAAQESLALQCWREAADSCGKSAGASQPLDASDLVQPSLDRLMLASLCRETEVVVSIASRLLPSWFLVQVIELLSLHSPPLSALPAKQAAAAAAQNAASAAHEPPAADGADISGLSVLDLCRVNYAMDLLSDAATWQLALPYLSPCPPGEPFIEQVLLAQPVSATTHTAIAKTLFLLDSYAPACYSSAAAFLSRSAAMACWDSRSLATSRHVASVYWMAAAGAPAAAPMDSLVLFLADELLVPAVRGRLHLVQGAPGSGSASQGAAAGASTGAAAAAAAAGCSKEQHVWELVKELTGGSNSPVSPFFPAVPPSLLVILMGNHPPVLSLPHSVWELVKELTGGSNSPSLLPVWELVKELTGGSNSPVSPFFPAVPPSLLVILMGNHPPVLSLPHSVWELVKELTGGSNSPVSPFFPAAAAAATSEPIQRSHLADRLVQALLHTSSHYPRVFLALSHLMARVLQNRSLPFKESHISALISCLQLVSPDSLSQQHAGFKNAPIVTARALPDTDSQGGMGQAALWDHLNSLKLALAKELSDDLLIKILWHTSKTPLSAVFNGDATYDDATPCDDETLERLVLADCTFLDQLPDDLGEIVPCLRELTLSWCSGLTRLPEEITSLTRLESLTISSCPNLSSLPDNFGDLSALKKLILRTLPLASLPDSFGHLESLETLTMYMLPLTELPDSFAYLTSLKTLFMVGCRQLRQLPENFGGLGALQMLCMVKLPLVRLPEGLGGMAAFQTIFPNEVFNPLQLPGSLTQLTSLTRLDIDLVSNEKLPEGIEKLNQLRQLNIQCCFNLREIPESVTALTNLETLTVGMCSELVSFPKKLDTLLKLRRLELTGCHPSMWLNGLRTSLPSSLESLSLGSYNQTTLLPELLLLPNLTKLTLNLVNVECREADESETSALPRLEYLELVLAEDATELSFLFASLPQLRALVISRAGNIETLPGSIGSDLKQLRRLQIEHAAELRVLPETVSQLVHLTSLDVHAPKLTSLPASIGALFRLRELNLSDCSALEGLPASLTRLACLSKLSVENTAIRLLPGNFAQLTRLKRLDLFQCEHLEDLPEDFSELKMLQVLKLGGCTDEVNRAQQRMLRDRGIDVMYGLRLGW
ncbi:unnamed protein product [Closterium sp. Yama58-4]|nr:unnamed protein product [Closterium sp. Yama58-4]